MQQDFFDISKKDLEAKLVAMQQNKFRAAQIWNWVYVHGVAEFHLMSNIDKKLRGTLSEMFSLQRATVSKELVSLDHTQKWLLKFSDNNEVEAVFIPDKSRGTLCISSQIGCTLTCKFCHTGTQNLVRNLSAGEIVKQLIHAKDQLNDWPSHKEGRQISNIVMMGMGEPLLNYDNVVQAIQFMLDPEGLNISKHKVTISTSGIIPKIESCANDLGVNLAVSLHAVTDQLRNELVPINKKYPIQGLMEACKYYSERTNGKRITFEYVMLKNVNDTIEDAKKLITLIAGIPAKINLIPFNDWPGSHYTCSEFHTIKNFAAIIEDAGYKSPVRTPRGQDIMAACGQLKSESIKEAKHASHS